MTTPKRWQEIDRIFAEALEREPGARSEFLDEACAGDKQLRAEVESLIAYDVPDSLVGGPAVGEATRLLSNESKRGPDLTAIGPYQVVKLLGAGGMGRVYQTHDPRLNRQVAVKLLSHYGAAEEERIRRFRQEAFAASALNHPNILTIYEIGDFEGQNFIATEFVDGDTLRARLGQRELLFTAALEIAIQVASALSAAHEAGIVHRDVKPENVMIRADGLVKVLDFGIAKYSQADGQEQQDLVETRPGSVMGTAPYMSPEQARGLLVDARSDIWSLGVMLYEMITGRLPFLGETVPETISLILQKKPAPLARYTHDVPAELERIITKALTKDREERYQTAKDLLIDLRNLKRKREVDAEIERTVAPELRPLASTKGSQSAPATSANAAANAAHSASSAEYIVSGIKKNKLAAMLTLVVLIVAVVGLSAYLSARNTAVAIDSIAVLPFQNRSTETDTEYLSDGLAESLLYRLSQLPNLKVSPTSSVLRYKGKEIDPIKVGQELGVNAVLSGRIVQRGDNLTISAELLDVRNNRLLWGEQYDRKMSDLLATQREIAREIVEKLKLKVAGEEKGLTKPYTENNEAYELYLKGRFYWNKRTAEALKKSIEYFNQAIEKDPGFALAYAGLADCYVVPANRLPPREAMPRAKAAAIRALELDEKLAEAHTSLARVLSVYDWDWTNADKEYKRAIELNPRYAIAHQWYGGWFEARGRHNEAIAERKRALELDPLSSIVNFELGVAFYYARAYDQAIEQFQKTLELDQNFPPAKHFLAATYLQKGMYDKAIAGFREAIPLLSNEVTGTASLGHVYALSGKQSDARTVIDQLKQLSGHQYVAATNIALIYGGLGEKDQAFAWLEKGYEERSFAMSWLNVEPRWDSLRSDPRFADLIRRMGLPQ
jgi:serine/threonine protein kinase/tetratricopeptide (TPR) repeat protein